MQPSQLSYQRCQYGRVGGRERVRRILVYVPCSRDASPECLLVPGEAVVPSAAVHMLLKALNVSSGLGRHEHR